MKDERYWLDIESGIIFDNENEKDFNPVKKLNRQDQQISDLEKENKVLQRALELACEDISLYEDITTPKYKTKCYIKQAKEKLNGNTEN